VIGLGYVGLLTAVVFSSRKYNIVGVDVDAHKRAARLSMLKARNWRFSRVLKSVLYGTRYVVLELSRNAREVLRELLDAGFTCKKARSTTYALCERGCRSV
jgi:hypothetical protein